MRFLRRNKIDVSHCIHPLNYLIRDMEEYFKMARKKSNQQNFGGVKFAEVRLDKSDRKDFLAWVKEQQTHQVDALLELVTAQWKISFSFDSEHDTFICSMTQKDEDDVNYNICVTSRSSDAYEALFLNYYKLVVVSKGKSFEGLERDSDWG
jgi:hypothetical protein